MVHRFQKNIERSGNCCGFSLLEIMIAMAIMAIMVAFALPNLGGSPDKLAKQEVLRLVAAIELVKDQSIILNREFGLVIDKKGYQFLELVDVEDSGKKSRSKSAISKNDNRANSRNNKSYEEQNSSEQQRKPKFANWQEISEIPELGRHEFSEGLDINLTLDEENLFSSIDDEVNIFEEELDIFEDEDKSSKKLDPPQIYFLSSGEQNQFSIGIAVLDKAANDDERYFFRVRGFLTGELKYEGPLRGNLFQDLDRNYDEDEF